MLNTNMSETTEKSSFKQIFNKAVVLGFTSLAILTSAAGCTIPGLRSNDQAVTRGILKRDPSISQAFGKINTVNLLNGTQNKQGLTNISSVEVDQVSSEELFLLTLNKGLFYTANGGRSWSRRYIYPVDRNSDDVEAQVGKNDAITNTDLAIDETNSKVIFVAGIENGRAKIFRSVNSGDDFDEVYSEVETKTQINSIAIDPSNNANVFATLDSGVMIKSSDSGETWQKLRDFNNSAIQAGFVKEFDNTFYVLLRSKGLLVSPDLGQTWNEVELSRNKSTIGENQGNSFGLNSNNNSTEKFRTFESIQPIRADKNNWIVVADKQLWITDSLANPFNKLVLPLEDDKFNFAAVATDPENGKKRILASINNSLFESNNGGQTWSTKNTEGLGSGVGSINQIFIDEFDTDIVYLPLI